MYITLKHGILKIILKQITFKTWREIDQIKQARRESDDWTPAKHIF